MPGYAHLTADERDRIADLKADGLSLRAIAHQVLFQDALALSAWEVLPAFGSDHYPVLAELCLRPDLAETQSAPALREGDLAEAEAAIRAARRMEP